VKIEVRREIEKKRNNGRMKRRQNKGKRIYEYREV
jgi:hypothetical protein